MGIQVRPSSLKELKASVRHGRPSSLTYCPEVCNGFPIGLNCE